MAQGQTAGWILLLMGTVVLIGLPDSASAQDPTAAEPKSRPVVEHKETPVPAPEVPVLRESMPRSPRAIVTTNGVRSVQVNVDAMHQNIVGDAANEPTIAIDPTNPDNIVIGWRQFATISSNFRQAGMAYSHDGGETWTFPGPLDPAQFRSDPVLATDSAGNFYYYSLSSVTTTEYFISTDKGVSWTLPTFSPGGDKNWQTIDASGGIGDGHVYPIWNSQFTCCAPGTDFSRSTNAATTFEGPYVLPTHPKWGTNDVGPDGELYIVGATLDAAGHLILRSDDAENALVSPPTFSLFQSFGLGGTTEIGTPPNPGGLAGQVWVAVDRSAGPYRGYVYALGSVDPVGPDPLDVHFVRSKDGGQTWSAPARVNDDPSDSEAYQWFGTMSVSPDGRIDVVWNDTRVGPVETSELYYAYSLDAGQTFSSGLAVSPSFDSTIGWPSQNKIGDYYHMISESETAALAWSATFNGEQDVYFTRLGDCNENGIHDSTDILDSVSTDLNTNGVPDECEPDCNVNLVPDDADISAGNSTDCDANGRPDECDIATTGNDCDGDGVLDGCEILWDLELDPGFVVGAPGDTAIAGIWTLADPIGSLAQPEDDHTPDPGSFCYITGQSSDVDGGTTTLISPSIDLSTAADPRLGYWRWYSNDTGGDPGTEIFVVDLSADGGQNWANVEVAGPTGPDSIGGWRFFAFRVADVLPPSNDMVLRFVASDFPPGSEIEAAIDDVVLVDCAACPLAMPAEVENLRLSRVGAMASLEWDSVSDAAGYSLYRGAQRDASDLTCVNPGIFPTSSVDDGQLPGPGGVYYYLVTARNCGGESTLGPGRTAAVSCP